MPGVDGCQFARRVRARTDLRGLYLVALTGRPQDSDTLGSAQPGFDRHLAKPVRLAHLTAVLASARAQKPLVSR
ncbi:hypothetical protein [Paraburkholderia sp. J76]|uniref:hypothetical protein n=1 Tax=Paraburkholderia sp. J76 TaxID=2805439 RepID=UPI002ABE6AAB|nr:hypothetical protein [Paraburkholderia sp. J76]